LAKASNQSLFEGTASPEAVRKLSAKLASPVRVLSIEIKPMTLTMQVQDPAAPSQVNEYTYRNLAGVPALILSAVVGPTPVRLSLINPNLEENLFNLGEVNLNAVPTAVCEAVQQVALDGGGAVQSITIQRHIFILPQQSSGDVEWRIAVGGPRESATAYADAQGRITHLDLSGTRRAETLDYTQDAKTLADAIGTIRNQFGAGPIYNHIGVSRLNVGFTVRDPNNPKETHGYFCNLNGINVGLGDALQLNIPKSAFDKPTEFFSIDDIDWSRVPSIKKIALEKIVLPNGHVLSMDLSKPAPKLKEQPLRWRVQVVAGMMGESGFAQFDPKSGQLTKIELPPSQVKAVDYLEPVNTQELLANIKEDFGQGAQFKEISIDHNGATVKAVAPGKRDEIQQYTYDARERANPESSNFPKSPFDSFEEKDLFGIAELQSFEARIPELEKKTIERLRIPDGRIKHLTFYRRSPFYPGNKKLLLQIWCEGKGDGRIIYDPSGSEYDIVGGHPVGPLQTTAPQMKSGIFVGEAGRFTSPAPSKANNRDVEALLKQWNAVMDADAAAEEKCNATRWGQLAEKGPVTPADISLQDSREYSLAERGRIETAKKCLAFLERPETKALMPQLITTTEQHGLDHRKFFDLDFWRATIRRMTASNELKKLTEEHWEEFRQDGFPKEGPNLKPWQQKYLGLEAEEKAAREERHRIMEKYRGTSQPNFKPLGITDATADRVARFDTLFTSFLTLSQKYGDTRWGKMRVSAPDKVLRLPREEFRKWAKVQRELLDCVDQILKIFAERNPPADAIMSSKAAAHASKREFWESHRKVWDVSCQQSKLLDKNWADWVAHGFPDAEAKYKPWQKDVMRLQSEINAAQQHIDELSPAHK